MNSFTYHRPTRIEEASKILSEAPEGKFLAGGMTLLPTLKQRLANPSDLIDLSDIEELRTIHAETNGLTLGAMVTHDEVAHHPDVLRIIPALTQLAGEIGDPQVRNRGTIGGSLANNDPAADYPAAVLALNATIKTNKRSIEADAYFKGLFDTALEIGEMILAIHFPKPDKAGYCKFPQPASRFALVGVFVAKTANQVRVAITGAGSDGVFRSRELEEALTKNFSPEAARAVRISTSNLSNDLHGDAEYRAHLIPVLAGRAVASAS